ncbi:MAG TPA: FtsX-like permease family protein [bacterium]|nr:FtsX-like permease family protein [bacterium]
MLREIFHTFRQYKSRTAMTMFGIIWGTLTVVLLLAFGAGVEKSMSKNMHGMGESIVIVWPGSTSIPFGGYGRNRRIRLTHEDMEIIRREVVNINRISPEYSRWNAAIRRGEKIQRPNIAGVIPEYGPMRNIWPEPGGRWLNEPDLKFRRRVVFLGNDLRDFLFGKDADAIGEYVYIGDSPFQVVGVLRKKTQNSSYSSQDKDRVFIPATTHRAMFGDRYVNNFLYQVRDPRITGETQKQIYAVMGKKYQFHPDDTETMGVWDTTEMDKFIFYFSLGFNIFMGMIGTITLIVGGIGLANIMYVVVQERTREIGIRRSVGARQRTIMGHFVLEAFLIIGVAAFIGFLLALIMIRLISLLPIEEYVGHPELNLGVALVTVAILGAIGFFAGFFPARRASKLDVVECLRY